MASLKWKKLHGKNNYRIYSSTAKRGKYKLIGKTSDTTFTAKKLKLNKTYKFKVKLIPFTGKSFTSKPISAKARLASTKLTYQKGKGGKRILRWNRVDSASGYIIYKQNNSNKKFEVLKKIKGNRKTSYIDKSFKKRRRNIYKIQTFKKYKKKILYSKKSPKLRII